MALKTFNSTNGFSVGTAETVVIDSSGNITGPSANIIGNVNAQILISTNSLGQEGGEINLKLPTAGNTTLSGTDVIIDSYTDWVRVFEGGGTSRGVYVDIANSTTGGQAAIGYREIQQISLGANTTANTFSAGKHYYSTTAGNLAVLLPTNANDPLSVGTVFSIVVQAAGNVEVNADSGVTLYLAGNSTAGNRTVGTYGMATVMKVATDTWFINGTGVS